LASARLAANTTNLVDQRPIADDDGLNRQFTAAIRQLRASR
jgi:hypothetical protein